jgi:hypothetical protein
LTPEQLAAQQNSLKLAVLQAGIDTRNEVARVRAEMGASKRNWRRSGRRIVNKANTDAAVAAITAPAADAATTNANKERSRSGNRHSASCRTQSQSPIALKKAICGQ